jgi:tetratricopeptide (TPR) repeat protein
MPEGGNGGGHFRRRGSTANALSMDMKAMPVMSPANESRLWARGHTAYDIRTSFKGQATKAVSQAAKDEERDLYKSLSEHPTHLKWAQLGVCFRRTGRLQDAVDAYREGLDQIPNDPSILMLLGTTYLLLGGDNIWSAVDTLKQVRLGGPSLPPPCLPSTTNHAQAGRCPHPPRRRRPPQPGLRPHGHAGPQRLPGRD